MQGVLFKVSAVALVCVIAILIVRQIKGEVTFALKIAGALLIFGIVVISSGSIITDIASRFVSEGASEYITIMLKALGIALLTHIASSVCKDCGESTLSAGVEFAGKIEILILCLPVIEKILGYISQMISMGE